MEKHSCYQFTLKIFDNLILMWLLDGFYKCQKARNRKELLSC